MTRDTIVIGLDAMISDLPDAILAKLQEILDPSLLLADWKTWDLSQSIGADARDIARVATQSLEFWANLGTKTGAVKELIVLQQQYDIHLFTGRRPSLEDLTREWLITQEVPFDQVLHIIPSAEARIKEACELGAVAYLDHRQDVCEMARGAGLVAGQLAYPWNEGGDGIVRCRNWAGLSFGIQHKLGSRLLQKVGTP